MSTSFTPPSEVAPVPLPENVVRGGMFAAVAVPLGIVLWVVIWSIGFVSAIVAFAVAAFAAWLYRKGSGGLVSKVGALVIAGIVLVTILLSFYFGLVSDYAKFAGEQLGLNPFAAVLDPLFWPNFTADFGLLLNANLLNLLFALALGTLGAFSVIRKAYRSSSIPAPVANAPVATAPVVPPVTNPAEPS
ncbi:hypothetical protein [Lacisediminihabitans sp. H27-G8]|uniref:hypothetical protein n=1 Tax=Lacisediminihabitans sp. H27-G8 TaxID=3111909 RepID=UPI0038FD280C